MPIKELLEKVTDAIPWEDVPQEYKDLIVNSCNMDPNAQCINCNTCNLLKNNGGVVNV